MEYGRISPEWENSQSATRFSDLPISLYKSCAWSKVLFNILPPFVIFELFENNFHFSVSFVRFIWKWWKLSPFFMKNTFTIPILAQKSPLVNTFFQYFYCKNVRLNILNILWKIHKFTGILKIIFIFSHFLKIILKIWKNLSFTICS